MIDFNRRIRFTYTNYKGETEVRQVFAETIYFGVTKWHKTEQWLLQAWDYSRLDHRLFAMKNMSKVEVL